MTDEDKLIMLEVRRPKIADKRSEDMSEDEYKKRMKGVCHKLINIANDSLEEHGVEVTMHAFGQTHGSLIGSLSDAVESVGANFKSQIDMMLDSAKKAFEEKERILMDED